MTRRDGTAAQKTARQRAKRVPEGEEPKYEAFSKRFDAWNYD